MLFLLLRFVIWLAGLVVVVYFVLNFFGYTINQDYFLDNKAACQEALLHCQKDLVRTGVEGAKETCSLNCLDPKILIQKKN